MFQKKKPWHMATYCRITNTGDTPTQALIQDRTGNPLNGKINRIVTDSTLVQLASPIKARPAFALKPPFNMAAHVLPGLTDALAHVRAVCTQRAPVPELRVQRLPSLRFQRERRAESAGRAGTGGAVRYVVLT
ncbi:hypothetical protein SKAU_G00119390 [Synaphobranchus kaupii]|uniref:Uncharacterized protein n=1 Tax=Synaphobranchus kaupii TaxID=118154 RepID=A0A9Q1J286_SYNKA|nr:hypothetical protein SKAU_G00119390 [Synaphobranchus kaupii]